MQAASFLLRLFPYLAFMFAGVFSILEVIFPSLRDPDFNRWEIDDESGSYIQVAGWRKMLSPPRVVAQGYMSDNAACNVALAVGVFFILLAIFGIRHVGEFPRFLPDLFEKL
jgi:hypothetical protein